VGYPPVDEQKQVLGLLIKNNYGPKFTFAFTDRTKISIVEEPGCCSESYFLPIGDLTPLAGKQIINIDETRNKKLLPVTEFEKRFPKSELK
jgi:hypothetical protein